jgi:hypothetical protein
MFPATCARPQRSVKILCPVFGDTELSRGKGHLASTDLAREIVFYCIFHREVPLFLGNIIRAALRPEVVERIGPA